jgi:broad specificity phosphatase PhoE
VRLFLIRHGETSWSLSGQHTGTTDIELTENGRRGAMRMRPLLAKQNFALVLVSPMKRARETCELAGLGAKAVIEPALQEWNYGEYEGRTSAEIDKERPGWSIYRDGCPGGESPADVAARVDRLIARVRGEKGDVAFFAHGHVLRAVGVRWVDFPIRTGENFLLSPATLSILSHYHDAPAIELWNASPPGEGDEA